MKRKPAKKTLSEQPDELNENHLENSRSEDESVLNISGILQATDS